MQLKKLFVFAGIALLALTGCAKEITKADAQQYATDNFSGEAVETKGHYKVTVGEISGIFEPFKSEFKDADEDIEELLSPATAKTIERFESVYKYYLDGKKLQAKFDLSGKDAYKEYMGEDLPENYKFEGTLYSLFEFTEKGYVHRIEEKVHFNLEISEVGITIKGALNFELVTTYNN